MSLWLDLKGPILADTVYIDGKLVAKDVTRSEEHTSELQSR